MRRTLGRIALMAVFACTSTVALHAQARNARADSLRQVISRETELGRLRELGAAWNSLGHEWLDREQLDSAYAAYARARALRSQAGDSAGVAASTNNLGLVHARRGQLDSAIVYYRRAHELRRQLGDRRAESSALQNLAIAYADSAAQNTTRADSAIAVFYRALALSSAARDSLAVPELLQWIGYVHSRTGAQDSAVAVWKRAVNEIRDPASERLAYVLSDIGGSYQSAGIADSAISYYTRAVAAYQTAGDRVSASQTLRRIGDIHSLAGVSHFAMAAYRQALAAGREANDAIEVTRAMLDLAYEFESGGALDSAGYYVQEALTTSRTVRDAQIRADVLRQLASHHERRGSLDSARVILQEALALQQQLGNEAGQAAVLIAVAQMHYSAMRFDSAVATFNAALAAARTARTPDTEAAVLMQIAQYYSSMVGQQDSALHYGHRALALHRQLGDARAESRDLMYLARAHQVRDSSVHYLQEALAIARSSNNTSLELDIHLELGRTLINSGLPDSAAAAVRRARAIAASRGESFREVQALQMLGQSYGNGRNLFADHDSVPRPEWRTAAALYDTAWMKLERVRHTIKGERARIQFASLFINAARLLMDAWDKDARSTGSQFSARMAVAASERGRAQALVDLMRGADLPPARSLEAEASELFKAIARPRLATLSYTQGSDSLYASLTLPSGEVRLFVAAAGDKAIENAVRRVRQALEVDSAASYALGDRDPVVIGRAGAQRPNANPDPALADLGALLLPQQLRSVLAASQVSDLVIVPSAELTLVPFAALFWGAKQPLGSRYRLRYAPSLTALIRAEKRAQPTRREVARGSLVVGNPTMPPVPSLRGDSIPLRQLPGAAREARHVAKTMGTAMIEGPAATETFVRQHLDNARLIHLATHGYAYSSEVRARASFVALAPDAQNDGLLTVGEVIDGPPLRADLVVLSACQTALGNVTRAEGTVGLHWAFLAKGARSLLVSLWSVDDKVTEKMMVSFYKYWTAGVSKSEALRLAQDEIRKQHPNPRYWAAFQLVGAN